MRLDPKAVAAARALTAKLASAKVGDTVHVGGLPVQVVSNEEAQTARAVVCSRRKPERIPGCIGNDCRQGSCSQCGHLIWYSPSSPSNVPKICIRCMCQGNDNWNEEQSRRLAEVGE